MEKVHKIFYDKVFEHPSLSPFFEGKNRELIESQQTEFTISQMGGGDVFSGKTPRSCHQHMFITKEQFNLRTRLLRESLSEFGVSDELAGRWIKMNEALEREVVKANMDECVKRFASDTILTAPQP